MRHRIDGRTVEGKAAKAELAAEIAARPVRVRAAFPPSLIYPLLGDNGQGSPYRYIILHGGRAGSKSWSVARAILILGAQKCLRILCAREFMSSINQSVHKLLSDQIVELGLQDRYTIEKSLIKGTNGTEISFAGIRNNVSGLKSYEGTNLTWVEEASNVSKSSWDTLIPTIFRREGGQLIVTFNAELETDDTWQRFVVRPPPDSIVVKINYTENPFLWADDAFTVPNSVLIDEANYMRDNDPDAFNNVWLGYPKVYLENAVYGAELRRCQEEGRITKVPYDNLKPVHTFWDLGWTVNSIICAQIVGSEFHIIDFIESTKIPTTEYLRILQNRHYVFGTDWLPHDARAKEKGSGRSIEEILRSAGRKVQIVPKLTIPDGINATRTLFGRMWFDEDRCADLIQHLRRYTYDLDGLKPIPVHDGASHSSDALRYLAIAMRDPVPGFRMKEYHPAPMQTGWMR